MNKNRLKSPLSIKVFSFASSTLSRTTCCSQWPLPQGANAYIFHLWKQRTSPSDTSIAFPCPIKTCCPLLNAVSSSLLLLFSFLWPGFFPKVNFFLPPLHHFLYPIFPQACFKKWLVLTANSVSQIAICLFLPQLHYSEQIESSSFSNSLDIVCSTRSWSAMSLFNAYWSPFHTAIFLSLSQITTLVMFTGSLS